MQDNLDSFYNDPNEFPKMGGYNHQEYRLATGKDKITGPAEFMKKMEVFKKNEERFCGMGHTGITGKAEADLNDAMNNDVRDGLLKRRQPELFKTDLN